MAKKRRAPKQEPEEIQVAFGEQRQTTSATRCYFFAVTPTGMEMYLNKSEYFYQKWSRGEREQDADGNRLIEVGFEVRQPCTVKMAVFQTAFGKKKGVGNKFLYISLDPKAARIQITVPGTELGFLGRGDINYEATGLSVKEVATLFDVEVLTAPLSSEGADVRGLIIT